MSREPPVQEREQACSILVVDDMEANRAVMCRRLEGFGYILNSVDSGMAALASIAENAPDIVLLDYMMPQMSGIEVLHALRQNAATRDLPVIMVTARAESEATVEALDAGADDYVTKPIDFDVLRARIESQLYRRSSANDLRRANAALDERVTRRTMALADLEEELRQEIGRRRELEQQLGKPETESEPANSPKVSEDFRNRLDEVSAKFDIIFTQVTSGKQLNLAHMAELKLMIARLRQETQGS